MSRETAVNQELQEIRDDLTPQIPELADLQKES
jgi:hypothetical protein